MTSKQLLFNEDARHKILTGVKLLSKAVKVTLGPKGRNVAIDRPGGSPLVTKDGVTVAKEIILADPFENMGAQMVKEVASKTNDAAGDGTTTATLLAEAIYKEGLKSVTAGSNPIFLKRGIDKAVEEVVKELKRISKKVGDQDGIRQVATVSANWDTTIGNIISEAMDKVGKDGTITVEEANSIETTLDVVEGMQFDKGYISPYFCSDVETQKASFDEAFVFIYEKKLSTLSQVVPLLKLIAKGGGEGRPLLIVAEDVEAEALAALVVNRVRGGMSVCAVKAPGFGDRRKETLQDLAALTGAKFVSEDLGFSFEKVALADLGRAKKIVVTKDSTTFIEGAGRPSDIQLRVKQIRVAIDEAKSDFEREKLQERLAKLSSGVAVVRVGAATESEMKEKKDRVEDALHATRAAVEEGIVPGGGVALLRCSKVVDDILPSLIGDERIGADIVARSLQYPTQVLCENAGVSGDVVVATILAEKGNYGYNVATGVYGDLIKAGVVDPTKVTRTALQNAASIAGLLLTTECMITNVPEKKEPAQMTPQQDY